MHLFVTDTLADPYAEHTQLAYGLQAIAQSRKRADAVKRKADVTVVIGNPPYRERAEGMGGWVEHGSAAHAGHNRAILEDFRLERNGRTEYVLKNLYVYFWRWAAWKVWESTAPDPDGDTGVVCFISTSGYLRGPGFKGMREYLRRTASEGWIIDLTPEGQTPDVPTRIFPGVRQPLAIGVFVRRPDTDPSTPATIRYRAVNGRQADKFDQLIGITLDDDGWRDVRTEWTAPLTPAAESSWDLFPAMSDLMPWVSPGLKANRTWVIAPSRSILNRRFSALLAEPDRVRQRALFKETRDSTLDRDRPPLPAEAAQDGPLSRLTSGTPPVTRLGYRAFDRQWVISDSRTLDFARPDLWEARLPGQVFVVELHSSPIHDGPGLTFTSLIPDMHAFKGSEGGRTLPLLHPDDSPNLAPGLTAALSAALGSPVAGTDILAYVAAVVAHPGFTRTFTDELTTPGIRVPITADADLWCEAVSLGEPVVWLHTYGEASADPAAQPPRPAGSVRLPAGDPRQPLALTAVTAMPETMTFTEGEPASGTLHLGTGTFGPVSPAVWDYAVGGRNVLKSWFNYRKKVPGGKKTSPLDGIHVETWDPDWTTELIDLLTVLTRLVEIEPAQSDLLRRVLMGPLLTIPDLRVAGVRWPTGTGDRRPRRAVVTEQPDTGQGTLV